jgi:outer membrane protein assembly factor BamB
MALVAAGRVSAQEVEIRVLPRPPFAFKPGPKGEKKTRLKLTKSSEKRNQITDNEAWLMSLSDVSLTGDLMPESRGKVPEEAPESVGGLPLTRSILSKKHALLIYGERIVVGFDARAGKQLYALDFANYLKPGVVDNPRDREFTTSSIRWAEVAADGTLYVSSFHNTYSRSSGGQNGYITALDPLTGKLKWRSAPLTCNTRNFLLDGDAIISGYGFTEEPDFLYVLDRKSGEPTQVTRVKTGPEMLIPKDGKLFVRTYDTNYVFRIRR